MREPKDREVFEIYMYRMVKELYEKTEKGLLILANNCDQDGDYWNMLLKEKILELFKNESKLNEEK